MSINYNHLYYFWVIAKEGGVTAACRRLGLTQPTLSAQLKQLEDQLGKNLFERKSRKLILNDAGRLVFDYADTIFKKGDELIVHLNNQIYQKSIEFKVGILGHLPRKNVHNYLKVPLLRSNVQLSVVVDSQEALLAKLQQHELDMVISDQMVQKSKEFECDLLEKVPMIIVGPPELKSLKRRFPESIKGQNIYLPSEGYYVRSQLNAFFKKAEVPLTIKGEFDDLEMLRVVASSGNGLTAVPRSSISDLIKSKEVVVVGDSLSTTFDIYAIRMQRSEENPILHAILRRFVS